MTPRNQSVFKAFAMLDAFHHPEEWLTNSELSRRAKLPEASGYRLIQTLEEIGAVVRGPHGRYRPGMLLVSLSENVSVSELFHAASQSIVSDVADRLDVTVHLGLLEGGMVTYVSKASTPRSFASHTRPGSQLEAYCSGLGKVLLAALPDDELRGFVNEGELIALTPYTITDRNGLVLELERVRAQGFAIDDREISVEIRCVAVPVLDGHGKIVAAMSATEHADRMTAPRLAELRKALVDAAAALGRKVYPANPRARLTTGRHLRLVDAETDHDGCSRSGARSMS